MYTLLNYLRELIYRNSTFILIILKQSWRLRGFSFLLSGVFWNKYDVSLSKIDRNDSIPAFA